MKVKVEIETEERYSTGDGLLALIEMVLEEAVPAVAERLKRPTGAISALASGEIANYRAPQGKCTANFQIAVSR